jgi:predicted acylesterase/phospholipase RssA
MSFYSVGVCKALFEQKLLPKIFTGASAGSLIAAMICVRTDDEMDEIFQVSLVNHIKCTEATLKVFIDLRVGADTKLLENRCRSFKRAFPR